jgi:TonB family protein
MLGDSPADAVAARPPATTSASATKAGQLDPAVIQAVLRQESKRFRRCYEQGRARKSDLVGKVVTRFVIDVDGHVASASDAESTIADDKVVECVVARVRKLQFPRPEGGKVQVVYPIRFEEAL